MMLRFNKQAAACTALLAGWLTLSQATDAAVHNATDADLPLITAAADDPGADKPAAKGAYKDASGVVHPWSVTAHHALTWDRQAYLPVGGVFVPKSWQAEAADADFAADVAVLKSLHDQGISDLVLSAGPANLLHVAPSKLQAIVDYLDEHEFHYGVDLNGFPTTPLVGYDIRPALYRLAAPGAVASFGNLGDMRHGVYFSVSADDGEVLKTGTLPSPDGNSVVVTDAGGDNRVLLLFPERAFAVDSPERHMPDLWQGFDGFRDSLLVFGHNVHFGKGLRFFLDPIVDGLRLAGAANTVVPTSPGFHLEFEAWLGRKYHHDIGAIGTAWGSTESDFPDFATAARCIPLWSGNKGLPQLYDPVSAKSYPVETRSGINDTFWQDLKAFRADGLQAFITTAVKTVHSSLADVPVLYRWSERTSLFVYHSADQGPDGFAYAPIPDDPAPPTSLLAQAEENGRSEWLVAAPEPGISSTGSSVEAMNTLKANGLRGFFNATLAPAAGTVPATTSLSDAAAFQQNLYGTSERLEQATTVLWYPASAAAEGLTPHKLSNGVWWLPTSQPGQTFHIGPDLLAYSVDRGDGLLPVFVVWSPRGGTRTLRWDLGRQAKPTFTDSAGLPLKVMEKKGAWSVPVGPLPIQISHLAALSLPSDVVPEAADRIKALLAMAERQHVPTQHYKDQMFYALNSIDDTPQNVPARYNLLQLVVDELEAVLRPYTWIEGEAAKPNTFGSVVGDPAASGGGYIMLDTDAPAPADTGYVAGFRYQVNAPGRYELWMAGSPMDGSSQSALRYTVDNGKPVYVKDQAPTGPSYGKGFVWTHLGTVAVRSTAGTIEISVKDRAPKDNLYHLSLDALCLYRGTFNPNGIQKPVTDVLPDPTPTRKR